MNAEFLTHDHSDLMERNEMGKNKDGQARGIYTLEFKMEAVRLVQGGRTRCLEWGGRWST
jgi:hypothetical protein